MQNNPPGPNDPTYIPQPPPPPPQYTQYPQTPYPPPPVMQPSPKKRRTWLWIIVGIVALIIFYQIGQAALSQTSTSTPPAATQAPAGNTPAATQPPAVTPTPTSSVNTIGKAVVVNADWTVTLNKVSTSKGTEFDTPKAGNIYLIVNVTLQNTSGQNQHVSTLAPWSLKDESGQTYTQDIFYGNGPDGTVAANGKIRGNIAYEVPKSVHNFILQFVPDLGGTDLAEWNVSI
jgi:hypothetical protein